MFVKLPNEIIDKILSYCGSEVCIQLRRYYSLSNTNYTIEEAIANGQIGVVKYFHSIGKKLNDLSMMT